MKELNNFRDFLNENKEIAADYADRILGAGEFVDPMELIDFYVDNLDDLPEPMKANLFMANLDDIKDIVSGNVELHEGTWGLGSPESIGSIIQGLDAIRKMADDAQNKKNAAGRGFIDGLKNQLKAEKWNTRLYNIVGDDEFHDAYDAAKSAAQLNDFDEVKNKLGDAMARAVELRATILKNRGLEEGEVEEGMVGDLMKKIRDKRAAKKEKERFTKGLDMKRGGAPAIDPEFTAGLEENDAVLDEVIAEGTIFDEIDDMLSRTAIHMKAGDFVDELVQEFEVISGGTKILHQALKNIVAANGIPEADFERDSAIIKKMNEE